MPGLSKSESITSLRPASISQPHIAPSLDLTNVPVELQLVLGLLSLQHQRRYCDGYVLRMHVNLSDGKLAPDQQWYEYFAQLNGTMLSLWDAAAVDEAASQGSNNVMPQHFNVADAILSIPSPQEHQDHTNVLAMTTAGENRYFFEFQNMNVLMRWTTAFRIAMYERAMLHECYTAALIARARSASAVRHLFAAYHGALGSKGKYSGWVKVRFEGHSSWERCWTVVSDTPSSWMAAGNGNIHERLWYKFSNKQSLRGEVRFYESRRDPKSKPLAILASAYSAYAVYPENPSLVDSSTLIKVEGSLTIRGSSKRMDSNIKDAFVLLMPDDIPIPSSPLDNNSPVTSPGILSAKGSMPFTSTRSRHRLSTSSSSFFGAFGTSSKSTTTVTTPAFESMLTWLVAIYDAFGLYGRPERLITDTTKVDSMIFAMPSSLEDAYLDVEDVYTTLASTNDLKNNNISSRDWRIKMKEMTLLRIQEGKKVFNSAILLASARPKEIPVIKEPKPSLQGPNPLALPDTERISTSSVRSADSNTASVPVARVSFEEESRLNHVRNAIPPRVQQRLGGFFRKKSKNSISESSHSRNFSESEAGDIRPTNGRFSLQDDSEGDNDPEMIYQSYLDQPSGTPPHLRDEDRPSTADTEIQGRPNLSTRTSSHRRVNSDTRVDLFFREAQENTKKDESDEDSSKDTKSVSNDMIINLPVNLTTSVSPTENLEAVAQANKEFDLQLANKNMSAENGNPNNRSKLSEPPLIPGSKSEIPSETPPLMPSGTASSPSSSMESLPVLKARELPFDNAYYAEVVQNLSEAKYNHLKSQPALLPYNGQPVPVRRVPSPNLNPTRDRVVAWQPGLGSSTIPQKYQPHRFGNVDGAYVQQQRELSRAPSPRGARPMPVQYRTRPVSPSSSQSMEIRGLMADPNPNGHLSKQERESMARSQGQPFLNVVGSHNDLRKQRSFDERPIYRTGLVAEASQQQQERRDMLKDVNLIHHKYPQRRGVPVQSNGRNPESVIGRNNTGMAASAARVALGDTQTSSGLTDMWVNNSHQGFMPPPPIGQPLGMRSMSMTSATGEHINWEPQRKTGFI